MLLYAKLIEVMVLLLLSAVAINLMSSMPIFMLQNRSLVLAFITVVNASASFASIEDLYSVILFLLAARTTSTAFMPSSPIVLLLRSMVVMVWLNASAVESALAPSSPILFLSRLMVVMVSLDSSAVATALAPSTPILLLLR